jgi:glutamyl-tRNA synthetase
MEKYPILSFFTKLGSSDAIEYRKKPAELVKEFSLKKYGKAAANYDLSELERVNTKLIHNLNYQEVRHELPSEVDQNIWESIKSNLNKVNEIKDWWTICKGILKPVIIDPEFIAIAKDLLPSGAWDDNTWNMWISAVKAKTGRNGKGLFMPIRLALTSQEHGPELKTLLPVLGREKALARLNGQEA